MTRRFVILAVGLAMAASVCGAGQAAPPATTPSAAPLDLDVYLAELDRWSAAADRLAMHPQEAASLAKSLPAVWTVIVDGQTFSVPTRALRTPLEAVSSDAAHAEQHVRELSSRLRTMRSSAESLATPGASPEDARRKLTEILQRREFRALQAENARESLWDRFSNWVSDRWNALTRGVDNHPKISNGLLIVLVAGIGLLLLMWLLRTALEAPSRRAPELLKSAGVTGPRRWGVEAAAAAARGDYREAIRLAYRDALVALADAAFWQVDETRTPREYLSLVPRDQSKRPSLEALTKRFERVWYGSNEASADDFRAATRELEELGCPIDSNPATAAS